VGRKNIINITVDEMHMLVIIALIFAGQSIGALIGLIWKPSERFLRLSLSFAASMMVGISLLQLIPESLNLLSTGLVGACFLAGVVVMYALSQILPHIHPELSRVESINKTALMLTVGIALHNIPEGLAIGSGFAIAGSLGLAIALAIAAQDVPENIATIIPLYGVTNSRLKAFAITLGTILFELIGFILAYYILKDVSGSLLGAALALAAGFMTQISFHELMPEARISEYPWESLASIILGLICVLLTEVLI
jgi:ZIP family zinc transporter